jgi:type IV pilus assembly protein PilC
MPEYRYQMRTSGGQTSAGVISAQTAVAAAELLRARGNQVLALTPVARNMASMQDRIRKLNQRSGPSQRDILNFTTQLAVMIRAGISLRAAIEGVAEQTENLAFQRILYQIKEDLESGKAFSEALAKHPKQFNVLYINMVRASEMSGSFSQMLDRIAAYLAQQIETRAMVIGALVYPGAIASLAVLVTIFLLTFVLPRFAMIFEGKEEFMPMPTIILMQISGFMVHWWWAVILGIVLGVVGLTFFTRTQVGGWWFDHVKLKVPLFRRMFRALYISRSLHTMGQLVNAGVPMLDTLRITGDISGNRLYKRLWDQVHASVQGGKKIAQPLFKNHLLPRTVVQMVSAGEESGKLGEVLDEVSGFYAKQLKDVIKTVTSMIEPMMIVAMGGIVGFIAMAIILPIFKMSSLVK